MARDTDPPLLTDLMRFKPDGWTPNAWAVEAGVSRTVWTDIRRHGNPSRRTLAKLLAAAGSSLAEFEALAVGEGARRQAPVADSPGVSDPRSGWRAAPLPPIPVYATEVAGEWDQSGGQIELTSLDPMEVIDRLRRPDTLASDGDAYALTIVGESMWPRFRPGRRILVSTTAPVAVGDDVVVRLRGPEGDAQPLLIKELVNHTAGFVELRQFTPDLTFRVQSNDLCTIHKVVGEHY